MFKYDKKLRDDYYSIKSKISGPDRKTLPLINKLGLKGKALLDFGCGDGRYSKYFLDKGVSKIYGVDVSSAMISEAKKKLPDRRLKFLKIQDGKLPLPDNFVDVVFANFVIHYVKDTKKNFKEIARVMRPGASFVCIFNLFDVKNKKLQNKVIPIILNNSLNIDILIKTEQGILSDLKKSGLKILKRVPVVNPVAKVHPLYKHKAGVKIKTILWLVKKI